jgi:galactokinase
MREVRADAPGRVNLIGEHTDYHDGFVMPCAVPQRTRVVVRPRDDRRVVAVSAQVDEPPIQFALGEERQSENWGDYVQGLTWVLAQESFTIGGFDLRIDSDVPLGSGLSSSAALEIATMRALRETFELAITDVRMAQLAQRAEVEFVGAPVGIMDQMACTLAGERDALFLDTRSLEYERIPLPAHLALVVINSGVAHQHAGGDYVTRRRESEEAARMLGVIRLRDLDPGAMPRIESLPPLLARRARHVVTENDRVLKARDALRAGDLETFGKLLNASHASLRDDYEVSVEAVDTLVSLAQAHPRVHGARLTGGGFGGAIVVAVQRGAQSDVASAVSREFAGRTGLHPQVLVPTH